LPAFWPAQGGGHQVRWAAAQLQQAGHQHGVEPAQPRPVKHSGTGIVRLGIRPLVHAISTVPTLRGMGQQAAALRVAVRVTGVGRQYKAAGCKVGCCIPKILGTTPGFRRRVESVTIKTQVK